VTINISWHRNGRRINRQKMDLQKGRLFGANPNQALLPIGKRGD